MNVVNYLNPFSSKHHAWSDFTHLRSLHKATIIFTSIIISPFTFFLALTPLFRVLVYKFKKISLKIASPTINNIDTVKNNALNLNASLKNIKSKKNLSRISHSLIPKTLNQKKMIVSRFKSSNAIILYQNRSDFFQIHSYNSIRLTPESFSLISRSFDRMIKKMDHGLISPNFLPPCITKTISNGKLCNFAKLDRIILESNENDLEKSIVLSNSLIDFEAISRGKSLATLRSELEYEGSYNLLGKFFQLYSLNLTDETVISIDTYGEIHIDIELNLQVERFLEMIQCTYGRILGQLIINRYFRSSKGEITLSKVTYGDYKKVLVGAAVNVTVPTLKELFHHIKKGEVNSLDFLCKDILNDEVLNHLQLCQSFEVLNSKEINYLHTCFINFCNNKGEYLSVFHDLIKENYTPPNALKFDYYAHDAYLLEVLSQFIELDLANLEISISEHLAKKLVYNELKKGMIIPLLNLEENLCFYQVHDHLQNKDDGVAAFLFSPVTPHTSFDGTKNDLFLVSRGTCPLPSQEGCIQSWKRDLEFSGIGKSSFIHRSPEILYMIESYLNQSNSPVHLHISGHSLGGCDAQRALLLMMKNINANSLGLWTKIEKLNVITHNAPRVDLKTLNEFIEIHNQIQEKNLNLNIDLTHIRFRDKEYEDIVQWYGEMLIGAKMTHSTFLKTKVIFITLNENYGPLGIVERHGTPVFSSSTQCQISNMTVLEGNENEELQSILMQNYFWNNKTSSTIESLQQYLSWYFSPSYTIPRDMFHFFLSHLILPPLVNASGVIIKNRLNSKPELYFIQ